MTVAGTASAATSPDGANSNFANPAVEQGLLCRRAVRDAEADSGLPPHMLGGIALVESGRQDPVTGRFSPWPWTINAEGRDHIFETKAEAVTYARQLQERGTQSFDAGCLQVNLMYHPNAFQSLEEAFDPGANARYAVRFLNELYKKTGSWETASAWYHSANPSEGIPYQRKVVAAMVEEEKTSASYAGLPVSAFNAVVPNVAAGERSTLGSMPARLATIMRLAGAPGGAVLPLPYAASPGGTMLSTSSPRAGIPNGGSIASVAEPGVAQRAVPQAIAMFGRGLDAYRMRPVAVVGRLFMVAR